MMASRRWLTGRYDWTGLSRLMYRRHWGELAMLALVALLVVGLFTLPEQSGFRLLASHPEALDRVNLHFFAPKEMVHYLLAVQRHAAAQEIALPGAHPAAAA